MQTNELFYMAQLWLWYLCGRYQEPRCGTPAALLDLAPKFKAKIEGWLSEREIQEPSWDDYMEFDQDFCLGLATILNEIIVEAEGIELTACDDYDGITYLLYSFVLNPLKISFFDASSWCFDYCCNCVRFGSCISKK